MNEQPVVSVALCTYNGQKYITPQLQSVLSQLYDNLEIIIVDDCSSDGTWEILDAYSKKDARIKLYQNEQNLGYIKNFEKAINLCSGKYIALCDQDDIWENEKISVLVDAIKDHMMVYHNSDYIDIYDQAIGNDTVATKLNVYDGTSCLPLILMNCIHGHAVLFNSEIKKYIFPFNERYSHDWWLAYVAFNVGSVKYIDKVLVHYRQHQESITDTFELRGKNTSTSPVKGIERMKLDIDLLKFCADFKYNRDVALLNKAYYLLSSLTKREERIKSFWFLLKHFDLLFYLRYNEKKMLSKINLVRKICFF